MSELPEKDSKATILITAISFAILGFGAMYIAIENTLSLISDVIYLPTNIAFNKGAFYLWGVGFVLLFFVAGIVYTNFFKRNISSKVNKRLTQIVVILLLLTFLLPQAVHYLADSYLQDEGYNICESQSKQWLHVKTIVYSNPSCEN